MEKCRNKNEEIIGQNEMRTNIVLFIYTYIIKKKIYIFHLFIYMNLYIFIYVKFSYRNSIFLIIEIL